VLIEDCAPKDFFLMKNMHKKSHLKVRIKRITRSFFSIKTNNGRKKIKFLGAEFTLLKNSKSLEKKVLFLEEPAIQDVRNHFLDYLQRLNCDINSSRQNHFKIKDFGKYKIICTESTVQKKYNNQITIAIWHSSGFIKKAANLRSGGLASISDYAVCPSENMRSLYSKAFGVSKENVLVYGSLKTDYLFKANSVKEGKERFFADHPELKGKKLYVWCPTFRGSTRDQLVCDTSLNLDTLNNLLNEDEMLLIKLHPNFNYFKQAQHDNSAIIPLEKHDKILNVTDFRLQDLTIVSTCFISDYSATILDAIVAKKPVLFFAEDLDDYVKNRGLTFDYRKDVPNLLEKATEEEFLNAIRGARSDTPEYDDFRNNWVGACDGRAGERLFDFIKEKLA
jgi:CDP-glycerol glycerophosphotransferase (TagB/SpsB family)